MIKFKILFQFQGEKFYLNMFKQKLFVFGHKSNYLCFGINLLLQWCQFTKIKV